MPISPTPPSLLLNSNEFILGLSLADSASAALLCRLVERIALRGDILVIVPHMVEQEVGRNLQALDTRLPRRFYRLLQDLTAQVEYAEPPGDLVQKYRHLGLATEDAYIAAAAEHTGVRYFISENRHFLQRLRTDSFAVLDAATCLEMMDRDKL